ncbi:MAG: SulP family inorganic anion transporter, partial [Microthrixaceae bacterium]
MRSLLRRVAPVIEWLPAYRRDDFRPDLVAGLTVGAVLVPQAMAYAQIAGLPPETGLYASTVPILLYALFGSSGQLAVGPVAIVSLMTAAAIANIETDASPLAVAAALALLVGAVHLVLGGLRLGWLSNFLSHAVLVGFTSAAAILIGVSQARQLLGIDIESSERVVESASRIVGHLDEVHVLTFTIGISAIVALLALRRFAPMVPGALLVAAAAIALSEIFDLGSRGVALVGNIPDSLSGFSLPDVSGSLLVDLAPAAIAITLVGFLESIAVAKVAGRRRGYDPGPNHELVALGMANTGAGLFGGYPVAGSFSRTAVNAEAGARTPLASVVTAALVLATILFLTPLLSALPLAVLAAIVILAVVRLVDVAEIRRIARVKPMDMVSLGLAFVATLLFGVVIGISLG